MMQQQSSEKMRIRACERENYDDRKPINQLQMDSPRVHLVCGQASDIACKFHQRVINYANVWLIKFHYRYNMHAFDPLSASTAVNLISLFFILILSQYIRAWEKIEIYWIDSRILERQLGLVKLLHIFFYFISAALTVRHELRVARGEENKQKIEFYIHKMLQLSMQIKLSFNGSMCGLAGDDSANNQPTWFHSFFFFSCGAMQIFGLSI